MFYNVYLEIDIFVVISQRYVIIVICDRNLGGVEMEVKIQVGSIFKYVGLSGVVIDK